MKKLLAVTACPTGIAHTYMAAESIQKAAGEKNVLIKVETRGAVGVENELTAAEIAEAHAIIIAADTDVDEARFAGKPVVRVPVAQGIKIPGQLVDQALALQASAGTAAAPQAEVSEGNSGKRKQPAFYKHLMTGVSHMLPLVVGGGLIIALSFFQLNPPEGSFFANLLQIGGAAMGLMVPILAAFIAFSIGGKPALASGLVGGMLSSQLGAGFLGGILAGFLGGYISRWLIKNIKLPRSMEGLKPLLIVPFLSVLVIGLLMVYVIGTPVKSLMDALTVWLQNIGSGNKILLGAVLGGMMALDMGGPFNKTAYTFAVGLLASGVYGPMAAVMAAGMTPPLGIWLATVLAPKKFDQEEREAGKAAAFMGLSFITEGAIPFGAADPLRIIPAFMIGSGVTGALSMLFDVTLRAPHGGIFVLAVPNAISPVFMYLIAIVVGTVVTALLVNLFKKNK
jgi:fructose PTS system EIIBC or EIIC component